MAIKFKDFILLLKNDDNTTFTNYTVEDMDGNQIHGEKMFLQDWYAIGDWLVDSLCIDEHGRATIVVNGGNFFAMNFHNVQ